MSSLLKGSRQVAELAGVSAATVSRVFNKNGQVAEATRDRILKAANLLGYQPDFLARGLRGGRTHSIGILWDLEHVGCGMIVRRIADCFQQRHYSSYIADTLIDAKVVARTLSTFARRKVDAVVLQCHWLMLHPGLAEALQAFPAALAITSERQPLGVDQIVYDRDEAAEAVADHFVATGRRRPMIMCDRCGMSREHIRAFAARLRARGVNVGENDMVIALSERVSLRDTSGFHELRTGEQAMEASFPAGQVPPDALWCLGDELAVGAMRWCRSRGLQVPRDVAVVGFDDNPLAEDLDPPLASIERQDRELAELIGPMLWARLENPDAPVRQERLAMRFVPRESAG